LRSTKEESTHGDQQYQGQDAKTSRKRFAVEKTLAGFQNVTARKFTADIIEKFHAMMKERTAYDSLPAKQPR
jgi:hypothetical protein